MSALSSSRRFSLSHVYRSGNPCASAIAICFVRSDSTQHVPLRVHGQLPASFFAYCKQQRHQICGPVHLSQDHCSSHWNASSGAKHINAHTNRSPVHAQLPASFFAYRKQQHRWTCGPVQLWRRAAVDIWASSLPLAAKLELIVCYFGIRKFATHWVSLGFFCTLVPLSMFTPEVRVQQHAIS